MVNPEQIDFSKNTRLTLIANLNATFNREQIVKILGAISVLGGLSFAILLAAYFTGLSSPFFIFARMFLFLGLMAFVFLVFIKKFFRQTEDAIQIGENASSYQVFKIVDLETVRILSGIDFNKPDLTALYEKILASRRVQFIAGEMGMTVEFNRKLFSGIIKGQNLFPQIFALAIDNAVSEKSNFVTTADIFYGFLKISTALDASLMAIEINEDDLQNIVFWANNFFMKVMYPKTLIQKMHSKQEGLAESWASGYTIFLDRFSRDISSPAYFGAFSTEGREKVLAEMENVLSKESRHNCILTGEPGTGKTSVVYGLAEKIYWGETLPALSHKRVVSLDTAALLSGVSSPAEADERLLGVLNEAARAGNVILFIDDIHTLFAGSGGKVGTIDASEVIAPYLAGSNLRIVGVTTTHNYQTYIAPRGNIAGSMEKIEVEPADLNQTIRILEDLSLYFSAKYHLSISYNVLKEVYRLAERFVSEKGFPAKAVDMLENVCTAAKNKGEKSLDRHITDMLAENTLNVPIQEAEGSEKETLLNLESKLHSRVIGQDEAVRAVTQALQRARTQVADTKRPIGTFLFLGPTGVGKTELSKALAWAYFGSEENMVRMDMNEFQDASSVDRFIGRQIPGSEDLEGGDFVKKVREHPFSVVLLDELEKAHPDILNLFLQILDEGYFTDALGSKISFQNTIIIATSNAGANLIREGIVSGQDSNSLKTELLAFLQKEGIYKPEFLNRFDGTIIFKPLTKDELLKIARLIFQNSCTSLKEKGYIIQIEPLALEKLVEWGYQPEFGARPMRRVFQDKLESMLARKILEGIVQKGQPFTVKLADLEGADQAVGNA